MPNDLPGHRLDRLLGRGGSGEVWLAWTAGSPPSPVAIKRVRSGAPPDAAVRLRAEAAVLASVDHPNLLRVLDVVADPPGVALVLPYAAGGSLRLLLDQVGSLDPGEVVALLAPVADALAALHRHGLAHGDLTPDNVLLTGAGEPVVADVGVTRLLGAAAPGTVGGTPAYLDPARVAGRADGAAADLFALAVIAYEALTGRLPHRGPPAEVVALAAAGAHRPLTSWPSIPPGVAEAVERALRPDPAARPAGPVELVAALAAAVPPSTVRRPPPRPVHGPEPLDPARGHRTVPVASLAAAVGGGPRSGGRRRLGRILLAAGVVLGAGGAALVLGALGRAEGRGGGVAPGSSSVGAGADRTSGRPRPCASPPPPSGGGALRLVDLDGDGCVEAVRWDGTVLWVSSAAGRAAYRLGRPTDQVLLGDWDGDGTRTPALYRPEARAVFLLDRLPGRSGEQVVAARVQPAPPSGTAVVRRGAGRPDEVAVRP